MIIMPFCDVAIARHFVSLSVCIKGLMYPCKPANFYVW